MKPAIIFAFGLIAAISGVFIRSCASHIPDGMLTSWCGGTPPSSFISASHEHCVGCALIAVGMALTALSALWAMTSKSTCPAPDLHTVRG